MTIQEKFLELLGLKVGDTVEDETGQTYEILKDNDDNSISLVSKEDDTMYFVDTLIIHNFKKVEPKKRVGDFTLYQFRDYTIKAKKQKYFVLITTIETLAKDSAEEDELKEIKLFDLCDGTYFDLGILKGSIEEILEQEIE